MAILFHESPQNYARIALGEKPEDANFGDSRLTTWNFRVVPGLTGPLGVRIEGWMEGFSVADAK